MFYHHYILKKVLVSVPQKRCSATSAQSSVDKIAPQLNGKTDMTVRTARLLGLLAETAKQ